MPQRARSDAEFEAAMLIWMRSKGLSLVPVPRAEQAAARARLEAKGDLGKQRALRLLALWSLAPEALSRREPLSVSDLGDFLGAEGFALEDAYGERTLDTSGDPSC